MGLGMGIIIIKKVLDCGRISCIVVISNRDINLSAHRLLLLSVLDLV